MKLSGLTMFGGRPMAWLPDGSVVVSTGADVAVRLGPDGKEVQRYSAAANGAPPGGGVAAVAVSPDGRSVVLAGRGPRTGLVTRGWVAVYDAATGKPQRRWESATRFTNAAYTPDGSAVLLTGEVHQPPRRVGQPPAELDLSAAVVRFDPARGEGHTPFAAPDPGADFRSASALAVSPTGAQFAVAEWGNAITVYETASGAIRRRLTGHRNQINQLGFTPDGGRLVSVSWDGTGLVWDVAPPKPTAPIARSEADRRKRWDALASSDGASAYRAMGELASDPAAVAFVRANLKAEPAPTDASVDRLIARLDAAGFADREAAGKELDALGAAAVPRVRDRLPGVTSAEVRRRLEAFLKRHDRPDRLTGPRLRQRRAVELLETIGTPEAAAVLRALAGGATPLAREASASAKRLAGR